MGAKCSCFEHDIFQNQIVITDNNQSIQNDPEQNDQDQENLQKQSQSSDDGIALEQIQKMNTFQLDSYEIDDHLPKESDNYAIELQRKDFILFEVAQAIKNQLNKNKKLEIKYFSENYKRIPSSNKPYKLQNNDIYVGQWVKGKPFGIGSLFQNFNGTMYLKLYQGQLEDGMPQGCGITMWGDGSFYRGDYKDGLCDGHGILKKVGQFVYEGDWKKNLPDGKGYERWFNRNTYYGHYLEGKKHGKGRQTQVIKKKKQDKQIVEINEVYDGDFVNNLFDGDGKYEWPDGREYNGQWKQGKMHGLGVFRWSDGRTYKGYYKYDYKHGKGQFNWPDGKQINGEWVAGKLDGDFQLQIKSKDQIKVYNGTYQKGSKIKWQNNSNNSYVGSIRSLTNSQLIPNELANSSHKNQLFKDVIQDEQPDQRQQNDNNDQSEFFKKLELKNIIVLQNSKIKFDDFKDSKDNSKSSIDNQIKYFNDQQQQYNKSKQQVIQSNDELKVQDGSQNKSNHQLNQSNNQIKIILNDSQNRSQKNQQNYQQFNLSNDFSKVQNESHEKSKYQINQSNDTNKVIYESKDRSKNQINQSNDQINVNLNNLDNQINIQNDSKSKVPYYDQYIVNNESDKQQTPINIYQFDESKYPSRQFSRNQLDNQVDLCMRNSNQQEQLEQFNIFQRKNSVNQIKNP